MGVKANTEMPTMVDCREPVQEGHQRLWANHFLLWDLTPIFRSIAPKTHQDIHFLVNDHDDPCSSLLAERHRSLNFMAP
jgi:hypothetical protein